MFEIEQTICIKIALNNLQMLICHKPKQPILAYCCPQPISRNVISLIKELCDCPTKSFLYRPRLTPFIKRQEPAGFIRRNLTSRLRFAKPYFPTFFQVKPEHDHWRKECTFFYYFFNVFFIAAEKKKSPENSSIHMILLTKIYGRQFGIFLYDIVQSLNVLIFI